MKDKLLPLSSLMMITRYRVEYRTLDYSLILDFSISQESSKYRQNCLRRGENQFQTPLKRKALRYIPLKMRLLLRQIL